MVDRAIKLPRDVFAFSAYLHALHDPVLELFSGVGIRERLQDKTALVVPFSKGAVELLVPVVDFGFWTLLTIPRGEGAVDPNGFNQVSSAVPVDVLQAPVFEVKFPASFLGTFEVIPRTLAAAAAVVRLKRAVQCAVSVGDFLPQQAVVMPSVPFAMHFPTAVMAPFTDGAAGQVSLFEAVFLAFVVVNEGSEVAFV